MAWHERLARAINSLATAANVRSAGRSVRVRPTANPAPMSGGQPIDSTCSFPRKRWSDNSSPLQGISAAPKPGVLQRRSGARSNAEGIRPALGGEYAPFVAAPKLAPGRRVKNRTRAVSRLFIDTAHELAKPLGGR